VIVLCLPEFQGGQVQENLFIFFLFAVPSGYQLIKRKTAPSPLFHFRLFGPADFAPLGRFRPFTPGYVRRVQSASFAVLHPESLQREAFLAMSAGKCLADGMFECLVFLQHDLEDESLTASAAKVPVVFGLNVGPHVYQDGLLLLGLDEMGEVFAAERAHLVFHVVPEVLVEVGVDEAVGAVDPVLQGLGAQWAGDPHLVHLLVVGFPIVIVVAAP